MQRRILLFLTILLLLAMPTGVALAAQVTDKVVEADDVIRNDIVLFGLPATLSFLMEMPILPAR